MPDYISFVNQYFKKNPLKNVDEEWKNLAKSLIPWDQFVAEYKAQQEYFNKPSSSSSSSTGSSNNNVDNSDTVIHMEDFLVIKLLDYFHSKLFRWFNHYFCNRCGEKCNSFGLSRAKPDEAKWDCAMVELYFCNICKYIFRFCRYNHPGKLLQTREGRCGEWAIAFGFICLSFDYDVRLVFCTTDHVWVEVWSEPQQRWIHTDPCENTFDNPLLYQCGWNKFIDLVVAVGQHELRDVTWRYTADWKSTIADREKYSFPTNSIQQLFDTCNARLQSDLSPEKKLEMDKRWLGELAQFVRTPDQDKIKPNDKALKGRTSGALQWRVMRAEVNGQDAYMHPNEKKTIYLTKSFEDKTIQSKKSTITYDCQNDTYSIIHEFDANSGNPTTTNLVSQWQSHDYCSRKIRRNVEGDWKMCYLARDKSCRTIDIGEIYWKIYCGEHWTSVEIRLNGQTFESGTIQLGVKFANNFYKKLTLNLPCVITKSEVLKFKDIKAPQVVASFVIEAILENGSGDNAWQHAQLFRQSTLTSAPSPPFLVIVNY